MNCLHLLYLIPLLHSGLGSLPAPVNVSVDSHNFYHVLQWKPHPGTPTGTLYKIYNSVNKRKRLLNSTTASSLELKLDIYEQSDLFVLASYNGTESKSKTVTFTPFKDTKIGPAEVSLATCGNCIEINISLPNPDIWSGTDGFYNDPLFIIYWGKKNEKEPHSLQTRKKSYTLDNLEKGREYCVNVEIEIRTNKNTLPSESKCIFTSVESRRDTAVLGAVAAVLILVIGFLMTSIYFLYYTGYLCKGQTSLPKALVYQPVQPVKLNTEGKQTGDQEMIHYQMALIQGYTMTPENIDSCLISISSEMENQRVHSNPTAQYPAMWQANSEEEEEEEDDEEENVYMDRNANLSSSESSCRGSFKRVGTTKLAVSEDCGSLTERPSATMEVPAAEFDIGVVHAGLDQCEPEAEEATVSFLSERIQSGVQGHVISEEEKIKEKVEVCENSGNVDLFSVTLATLTVAEEEDQSKTDFLTVTDPTHPFPTVSGLTLSTTEYEMESDHEMTVPSLQPTHQDFTETWYEGRHAETQSSSSEEEEEEEEEFSGYMAHI